MLSNILQTLLPVQNQLNSPLWCCGCVFFRVSQETEFSRPPMILPALSDGSDPLLPRRDLFLSANSMLPFRLKNPRRLGVD